MKALLVLDEMPKKYHYPDGHEEWVGLCGKQSLKPMPKKLNISQQTDIFTEWFIKGYNACIDEILGEEE